MGNGKKLGGREPPFFFASSHVRDSKAHHRASNGEDDAQWRSAMMSWKDRVQKPGALPRGVPRLRRRSELSRIADDLAGAAGSPGERAYRLRGRVLRSFQRNNPRRQKDRGRGRRRLFGHGGKPRHLWRFSRHRGASQKPLCPDSGKRHRAASRRAVARMSGVPVFRT